MLEDAVHLEARTSPEHIRASDEHVFQETRRHDAQGNLAVDPAESQVVHPVAEGWNVGPFARIDFHDEYVLSLMINMGSQVKRERRKSTLVFTKTHAVEPYGRGRHHSFEVNKDVLRPGLPGKRESPPIDRHELVDFLIEAAPGQSDVGVGNDDTFEAGIVKIPGVCAIDTLRAVTPAAIQREDLPAGRGGACCCGSRTAGKARCGYERAGDFEE